MLLTESPLQPIGLEYKTTFIMGCVSSKAERDAVAGFATNANLFQVMNVDDTGRRLCPGQLEVGEADLILYQRGKSPVKWPLRSLRRYGFDAQLFSFECGRRCPTGPGIYAFHCRNAEILFNHVQARVAARHEEQEQLAGVLVANSNHSRTRINRHSMPPRSSSSLLLPSSATVTGNGLVVDREDADEENSYLEPIRLQQQQVPAVWSPNSRPLSSSSLISSSSSPISPSTAGNLYANNEALLAAAAAANDTGLLHHLDPMMMMAGTVNMDTSVLVPPPVAYANLHHDLNNSISNHANAVKDPRLMMDQDDLSADEADNQHHLYINVGPDAIEVKPRSSDNHHHMALPSLKQVNYVLLDLDKGSDSTTTASVTTTTGGGLQANSPEGSLASFPESPHRTINIANVAAISATAADVSSSSAQAVISAEGYATIDFDRTAALSNATGLGVAFSNLVGCEEEEQGLRKTRHNSTMVGGSSSSGSSHAARLLGLNRQTSSVSE